MLPHDCCCHHHHHHHPHYDLCVPYDDTHIWNAIENIDRYSDLTLDEVRSGWTTSVKNGKISYIDWVILRNDKMHLNMIKANPGTVYDNERCAGYSSSDYATGIMLSAGEELYLSAMPEAASPKGGVLASTSHVLQTQNTANDDTTHNGGLAAVLLKVKNGNLYLAADEVKDASGYVHCYYTYLATYFNDYDSTNVYL